MFVHIAQKRDGSVAFPPRETRIHGAGKRVLANFEVSNFFLNWLVMRWKQIQLCSLPGDLSRERGTIVLCSATVRGAVRAS